MESGCRQLMSVAAIRAPCFDVMNGVEDGPIRLHLINQGTVVMVDDTAEQQAPAGESGRSRRPPPTIDLEATEVSEQKAAEAAVPESEASAAPVEPETPSSETGSSETASDAKPQPEA